MSGPLAGVRVLDCSTMIAAPSTAAMLADFGADVVKLERPGDGDHVRRYGARKNGIGLYWKALGRNKRSVALDLHHAGAQALLLRWLPTFDIFIENFRPGTLEKWNLSPERMLAAAPHLVVLRMTAFGQTGPYRDRAGFGTLAEAMTGIAAVSGYDDRPPLLPAFPLADVMAGQAAAAAVCAAYARRLRTGDGDVIDFAIYEAVMKLVESQITEYAANGTLHARLGNRMEDTAPRGAYRCADGGYVALSGSTQEVAERVLRTIGGDALVADPRFRTNVERVANGAALDALIEGFCSARSRDDAIEAFTRAGCAVGPLESIASVMDNPQIVARGSLTRLADPDLGEVVVNNAFPHFARAGAPELRPGPTTVGADTADVLAGDLGLREEELDDLAARGIIARSYRDSGTLRT
ncbi:MAG: L-carnitine dehydratase/bile acid-inducible protein [Candidatus Eremiobacteraeota bacterium]|nr:L-carnitine dehydratase/bile acid-inducible protein [Candidatus Eremiobacteraeota bacterium]